MPSRQLSASRRDGPWETCYIPRRLTGEFNDERVTILRRSNVERECCPQKIRNTGGRPYGVGRWCTSKSQGALVQYML